MEAEIINMGVISIIPAVNCYRTFICNQKYNRFTGSCMHRRYAAVLVRDF